MSFKREGDDRTQLNVLKKRRISDLLSNFIPEDEASLLKNGRYCCLVCSYRPIFDTVDMLTVHRKGKRHLEGMKWFYGKKAQHKHEVVKRQHQEYVKYEDNQQEAGSSAPLLTQTRQITHHALLKAAPYSSCHKKASERSEKPLTQPSPDFRSHNGSNTRTIQNMIPTDTIKIREETKPLVVGKTTCTSQCQKKRKKKKASEPEPFTEKRQKELEDYLQLKSAGWIQDPSGKWMKDENVEFDSDEEEPPSLLPPSGET